MPIGLLNWELRDNGGDLGSDRGWILTLLYLHSNPRGRCWPSMKLLANNAGCGLAKADKIIDWLEAHGAIIKVPYDKRELEEKKLHQRKTVYQLTGIVKLDKGWLAYLKLDHPEQINTFTALVNEVVEASPLKDSIIKILNNKFLIIENSITESEGTDSLEGSSSSEGDISKEGKALSLAGVFKRWTALTGGLISTRDGQLIPDDFKEHGLDRINSALDTVAARKETGKLKKVTSWKYVVPLLEELAIGKPNGEEPPSVPSVPPKPTIRPEDVVIPEMWQTKKPQAAGE